MLRTLSGLGAVLLLAVFTAPAALAQGQTSAAIGGVVSDASGEPVPGANVVAVHEPSGTRYGAATRLDGRYDLRGLRVGGPYTVTATFIGFADAVREEVFLTLGQAQTLDFTLREDSEVLDGVVVQAEGSEAVISASRTGASTNVGEATIEALPTISRSLADFARLSPLSSGHSGGDAEYSFGGRNNRYNNIQVDGATLNDVFGLSDTGAPGGQTGSQPISLDAIEEFNVDIAPYDVRASGFTGGQINAVTKSGTNEFSGSIRYLGRNQELIGELGGDPLDEFNEGLGVFTLGGPIIRDKVFFFVSGELQGSSFPDNTGVAGSGATDEFILPAADVQRVIDAGNAYGYETGGFDILGDGRASNKFLAKIDWNVSPRHRFSVRANVVDARDDTGVSRGRTSFDLSNRRYVFNSLQNSVAANLISTFGTVNNEARLVYTAIRDSRDPEDAPFPETTINVTDEARVRIGIDRFSQANGLDQDLLELTNNVTVFAGDHTLTLGTSNQIWSFNNLFIQDFYGSYEFDGGFEIGDETLDATRAFELGLPSRYRFSYASSYDFDESGRLRFDADGNPVRTVDVGAQPRASFTAAQLALYAQDEWDVLPGLRLTGGLRLDVPLFPDAPVDNPLVSGGTGVAADGSTFEIAPAFRPEAYDAFIQERGGTAGPYAGPDYSELTTTNTASGNLLWSPRLGLNIQTTGAMAKPLQIRGGTGIFSGRTPYVFISNQYSNTGADLARLDVSFGSFDDFDLDGDGRFDEDERFFPGTANPADQPIPGDNAALQPIQTTEINLIADDFTFPQVWRSNLGIDQEIGAGFVATLEGIFSKSLNEVTFRNVNLAQVGTSAYGRPIYARGVNPNFTNAILLENTDEGYDYSVVGQIQRRAREGFGGSLSYTFNRAFNVNNASSSRAISNWQFNENVDVNDAGIGTADYEVRHRGLAFGSYTARYGGRLSTELGLVVDVQAGSPFSYIYNGDANGDGQRFNDLVFVPEAETDVFLTSENWDLLDAYIEGENGLRDFRGGFVDRNSAVGPPQARVDLELSQGVETLRGQRIDFEFTLVNLLNLINDEWGRIRFARFNNTTALAFQRYVGDADVGSRLAGRVVTTDDIGKPIVEFRESYLTDAFTGDRFSTANLSSRWQLRFGVKYSF